MHTGTIEGPLLLKGTEKLPDKVRLIVGTPFMVNNTCSLYALHYAVGLFMCIYAAQDTH